MAITIKANGLRFDWTTNKSVIKTTKDGKHKIIMHGIDMINWENNTADNSDGTWTPKKFSDSWNNYYGIHEPVTRSIHALKGGNKEQLTYTIDDPKYNRKRNILSFHIEAVNAKQHSNLEKLTGLNLKNSDHRIRQFCSSGNGIPGCGDVPYKEPTEPLTTASWIWNVDGAMPETQNPEIKENYFGWDSICKLKGKECNVDDGDFQAAIFYDLKGFDPFTGRDIAPMTKLSKMIDKRIESIEELNNHAEFKKYFTITHLYSEDNKILETVEKGGFGGMKQIDELDNQEVVAFLIDGDRVDTGEFITGTVSTSSTKPLIKTTDKTNYTIGTGQDEINLEQIHLLNSFKLTNKWLSALKDEGITADNAVAFGLEDADTGKNTIRLMKHTARYNQYAKQNEKFTQYTGFHIDNEASDKEDLQQEYLSINDDLIDQYGKRSPFELPIVGYLNQTDLRDKTLDKKSTTFAQALCNSESTDDLIFASNLGKPNVQCAQGHDYWEPTLETKACGSQKWTVGYEGSLNPKGAKPTTPLCSTNQIKHTRQLADIALSMAAEYNQNPDTPMLIADNPQVALHSFLPIYAQLVHNQFDGDCPEPKFI